MQGIFITMNSEPSLWKLFHSILLSAIFPAPLLLFHCGHPLLHQCHLFYPMAEIMMATAGVILMIHWTAAIRSIIAAPATRITMATIPRADLMVPEAPADLEALMMAIAIAQEPIWIPATAIIMADRAIQQV